MKAKMMAGAFNLMHAMATLKAAIGVDKRLINPGRHLNLFP